MMIVPSPSTIKPLPGQQSSSTLILKNNQGSGESLLSSSSSVVGHSLMTMDTKQSCEYYPMMKNNNNTTQSSSMNDHYNQLGQRKQPQLFISCEKRRMPQQPQYAELDQNTTTRITYQSNNCCTLPSYSRHDITPNNNHHLQQASPSSPLLSNRHYVAAYNKNDSQQHNNKRTRCDENTNDDAKSTDNNRQNQSSDYQSDLVPITTSQKRKIDNSSSVRIISEQTRSYQPMEDSTLLFLMDLVCKVVEKKEPPVHSPNLSSDMISCSASSNNSHCSSPQTCLISATGKQSYSPINNIESYPNNNYSNEPNNNNTLSQSPLSSSTLSSSTLSHNTNNEKGNGINKKQPHHRTSVFTIKELLN